MMEIRPITLSALTLKTVPTKMSVSPTIRNGILGLLNTK